MPHIQESAVENENGVEEVSFKKKDFMSDQMLRWCPGCGDYSILSQTQTVMANLGLPPHKVAVVSGIGCSSRFPYYMGTYGFHTIHGRAPAFASALKCVNPDMSVWMITGDGDGLSIGGNHLIHLVRRNIDLNVLLFNNRIYGLTKGQYSPTSEAGKKTKSSPFGSLERPFQPLGLALGAGSTFLARTVDIFAKDVREVLTESENHRGTAFVEILQNCVIFNDKAFSEISDRKVREERCLFLKHGEPMVFGSKDAPKGLRMNGVRLEVVDLGDEFSAEDCLVHDRHDRMLAGLLVQLDFPEYPVPMGILYQCEAETYDHAFNAQVEHAIETKGKGKLEDLIYGGTTWTVE